MLQGAVGTDVVGHFECVNVGRKSRAGLERLGAQKFHTEDFCVVEGRPVAEDRLDLLRARES
jgi:hypothetical protein